MANGYGKNLLSKIAAAPHRGSYRAKGPIGAPIGALWGFYGGPMGLSNLSPKLLHHAGKHFPNIYRNGSARSVGLALRSPEVTNEKSQLRMDFQNCSYQIQYP